MRLVYRQKDNVVIASISSNSQLDGQAFSSKMLADTSEEVSFCDLNISSSLKVIGCKLHFSYGIVYKISRQNGGSEEILFRLSEDDLNDKIKKLKENSKRSLITKFPFSCHKSSPPSFLDKISRLPQTYESVRREIAEGIYLDSSVTRVGWWGSFTDAGGYACMNRSITTRLHNFHVMPYIRMYPTIPQVEPQVSDLLSCYSDLSPKKGNHPFVYAYTPMSHEYHGGKRVFFTMFETATLHPVFVDYCNKFSDEIWVPSRSNKEIFSSNGIKKLIRVVPLGIDETIYMNEYKREKPFSNYDGLYGRDPENGLNNFKFVTVIQWNFRKGYDALIKSFVESFTDEDDVCLVITTQYSKETVLKDLNQFIPRTDHLPQVVLYNQIIPTVDMPSYYRQFDCYVHLSRGEGFSLTQIEAASCGLPVISCYHSGMTEYLSDQNSYLIKCDELEISCPRLNAICFYYQGQLMWKIGKKQIDLVVDTMRYVVNNYSEAKSKAEVFYSEILKKYTWDKTAERVAEIIKML